MCPLDLPITVSGVNALANVGLIIISLIIVSPDIGVNMLLVQQISIPFTIQRKMLN